MALTPKKAIRKVKFDADDSCEEEIKPAKVTPVPAEPVEEDIPEVPQPAEIKPKVVAITAKPAPQSEQDFVEFNCFETIDPSPVIGHFSFSRDMSITMLEKNRVYRIPRFVAEVLVDKKKGVVA